MSDETIKITTKGYGAAFTVSAEELRAAREPIGGAAMGLALWEVRSAEAALARGIEQRMFAEMEAHAVAKAQYERDLAAYRERSGAIFDAWERRIDAGHRLTESDLERIKAELESICPVPPSDPVGDMIGGIAKATAEIEAAKREPTALDRIPCYDFVRGRW